MSTLFDVPSTSKKVTIIDVSAVIHAMLHGLFKGADFQKTENGKTLPLEMIRKGFLGSLLYYKNVKGKPDETILAFDRGPFWRKEYIDYKVTRKTKREESDLDWSDIFSKINTITEEMEENLPWIILQEKGLEADDIIGILSKELTPQNEVRIISADGDLVQCQKYGNVIQWSPITKKDVKPKESPEVDLMLKIIKGDAKDCVPNIYTDSEFFTRKANEGSKTRQKSVTKKLINEALEANWNPNIFCDTSDMIANFERNKLLLDLENIPTDYCETILNKYNEYKANPKIKLQSYFMKHRLDLLFDKITEF